MAESRHAYPTLDLMRGVAALGVVLYHLGGLGGAVPQPGGYLAVDLFFMLSGFVISHAYGAKLSAAWSPMQFMTVRLIRLWPLHLLGFLVTAAIVGASL